MTTSSRAVHPANTRAVMDVLPSSKMRVFKEVQPLKQLSFRVTSLPIVRLSREEQVLKAYFPILVSDAGKETDSRAENPANP